MGDLKLDLNQPLELRIAEFKNDPEKMKEVNDFLNELFDKAQKEAENKSNNKHKNKLVWYIYKSYFFFAEITLIFCRTPSEFRVSRLFISVKFPASV